MVGSVNNSYNPDNATMLPNFIFFRGTPRSFDIRSLGKVQAYIAFRAVHTLKWAVGQLLAILYGDEEKHVRDGMKLFLSEPNMQCNVLPTDACTDR